MKMKTIRTFALVALSLTLLLGPVGAVTAQESANETSEGNETLAEEKPRETTVTGENEEQQKDTNQNETAIVEEVDDNIRVTAYSYNREKETMTVSFENIGEESTRVTMTEVISEREANSGKMGVEMFRVREGERLSIDIYSKSGAVMIVTEQSLQRGEGTFLKADSRFSLLSGPATWGLIRVSGLGGALGVLLLAVLIGWHRVADSKDKIEVNA